MANSLDKILVGFAEIMWGPPLLILLLGGGIYFTVYCRFIPFRYIKHGLDILLGKYNNSEDPGQISHFQALSSALASTVGMGNISGVAIAIFTGGPGALFWMWVSAILGMSTKFFTCTLSIMYRGKDENGEVQGGPMYVVKEGLPKKFHFLAYVFSIAGLFGCFSLFQANQLTEIISTQIFVHFDYFTANPFIGKIFIGCLLASITSIVVFGGIRRIGQVTARLVPAMVVVYLICGVIILLNNFSKIDDIFFLIIQDAFTGEAVLGGSLGAVIVTGVRRAAFSNEAGIGTEAMAHGAAITREPVREGLVAMLGPMIDTLIVCTITGFIILSSGVWNTSFISTNEITLTPHQQSNISFKSVNKIIDLETWEGKKFSLFSQREESNIGLIKIESIINDSSLKCSYLGNSLIKIPQDNLFKINENGISLTAMAFNQNLSQLGGILLLICVFIFSITTIIGYSYYGSKCSSFLFGSKWKQHYRIVYVFSLIPASVISIDMVINYVDGMFALMGIPTMISTIILAPKVMTAAKDYFSDLNI